MRTTTASKLRVSYYAPSVDAAFVIRARIRRHDGSAETIQASYSQATAFSLTTVDTRLGAGELEYAAVFPESYEPYSYPLHAVISLYGAAGDPAGIETPLVGGTAGAGIPVEWTPHYVRSCPAASVPSIYLDLSPSSSSYQESLNKISFIRGKVSAIYVKVTTSATAGTRNVQLRWLPISASAISILSGDDWSSSTAGTFQLIRGPVTAITTAGSQLYELPLARFDADQNAELYISGHQSGDTFNYINVAVQPFQ